MIKTIINFALKKPILNHFLLFFLLVLSILAYFKIPKEIFPPASLDAVSITGVYAGASSDLLDKMAVEDLEDELVSLEEASDITSIVKNGFFSINIKLKGGYEAQDVIDDVKDIVTKTKVNFPSDMDEPIVKEVIGEIPLITVVVYGDETKERLLEVADDLKSRISTLKDLSSISIWGDSDKELLIKFDENKIVAYGLNLQDVINSVQNISSIFPAGIIKDSTRHYYLSTFNGEKDINKINNTIIKVANQRVLLKDIAKVEFKLADVDNISHFNGKPDVSIGINKSDTGDAIELVQDIKNILIKAKQDYPTLEFDTHTDTSVWIKNRLNTVVSNILFGLCLLFMALFYFINVRIAVVIAIGIPTSFMIGLIAAEAMGYSLNMLSLLGALIALGMLVDEAIVVGENIYRHMEMGKNRFQAALDGAIEVYPAVLTATATTIFAFLPILLMTGEVGKFMKILPIMITILLISSLVEAFFFLPLHAKEIFDVHKKEKRSDRIWEVNKKIYKTVLEFLLKKKYISLFIMVFSIILATIFISSQSRFQFLPDFDSTQIYLNGSVGVGKKIEQTEALVEKIERKIIDEYDFANNIDSVSSVIGMKLDGKNLPQNEEFYFQIFINLYERAPQNIFDKYVNPYLSPKYDDRDMIRQKSAQEIEEELKVLLKPLSSSKDYEEFKLYVPGAGIVKNDLELAISGSNQQDINKAVKVIKEKLNSITGVSNVADDILVGNIELKFKVNEYGQKLGFTENYIVSEVRPFYFKGAYSKMFDDKGIVEVVFQSKNKDELDSINRFEVLIPGTEQKVLLKEVVEIVRKNAQSQIFKENSKRIVSITASIDKVTSSEVFEQLNPILEEQKKFVSIDIKGEQEENEKVQKEMAQAALIAIILIFLALIWMFDSLVKPLIIISTIPLSILGVLVGHLILGLHITMPSLIGMVGLAGVIVNDGIIMMDFIKKAKNLEEMQEYALMRLRPILLTSITTILGLSTLMFFASGQALILQPMAVALGFGILWATILNLYYVPMVYRIVYLRKAE
ncbi:efflux RND transporter permease subunit [Halarcobacter bivalviorum]|uniref:Acriflavin resistance protein n=1 Tax=Halarcobacter bivalviorum TaxID=663364 RepID=A0AAX2AC30_9BACT|nr:efflux RND transporter permease subunit [Halarcobacter bivalviorum]AXH12446.1 RND family efflux system, inner membrane transporter, AcrB family [Halarcobacter bivalviorum]RXK10628.1 acriflavin resistance protein [Halarcobacter bivalviorum]